MKHNIKLIEFEGTIDNPIVLTTVLLTSTLPIKLPISVLRARILLWNKFGLEASSKMHKILFIPGWYEHDLKVKQHTSTSILAQAICAERGTNHLFIT